MKKVFILITITFCFLFMGKIEAKSLSIEEFQNYTYTKDQIMTVYQSIRQNPLWSDALSKFVMLHGSDGFDYVIFLSTTVMNNPSKYFDCSKDGCDIKFGIYSYSDNSSTSKFYHDSLTYAYHFNGNTSHEPSGWAYPDIGAEVVAYRLNSDFTLGQQNSFPYSGNMFFTFDQNFKLYTNGTILFGKRSNYGKDYHGLLKGFVPGTQVFYYNLPKEDGSWTRPDEGITMGVDTSLIETEDKPEGVEACEYAQGDIFAVVKYIGCWLKNIWITIKNFFIDLFKLLFVPKSVDDIKDTLMTKFGFVSQVKDLLSNLIFPSGLTSKPDFQFTLFGKTFNLAIFDFFDQYRTLLHLILIAMFYILFIISLPDRVSKTLGGIN